MTGRRPYWAALDLLQRTVDRLHRGWETAPPRAHRAWWLALAAGFIAVEMLTIALVVAARGAERAGLLCWERDVLSWFGSEFPVSFAVAIWLDGPGNALVLWAIVLIMAAVFAWRQRPFQALGLLVGFTLTYPIVLTGWFVWFRARPAVVAQGIAAPGGFFNSFPSGHVTLTVVAYGLLGWIWSRNAWSRGERITALLAPVLPALLVSVGRLRLGTHWPTDIVAAVVVGAAWVVVVALAVRAAENGRSHR